MRKAHFFISLSVTMCMGNAFSAAAAVNDTISRFGKCSAEAWAFFHHEVR